MAENTYIKKEEPKKKSGKNNKKTIFKLMESMLGLDQVLAQGLPVKFTPKIFFVMAILIVYIANTHYADRIVRNTEKIKSDVGNLRADYTTLKADLMFKSKQSEVAKRVEPLGLEESLIPPYKIELEK